MKKVSAIERKLWPVLKYSVVALIVVSGIKFLVEKNFLHFWAILALGLAVALLLDLFSQGEDLDEENPVKKDENGG